MTSSTGSYAWTLSKPSHNCDVSHRRQIHYGLVERRVMLEAVLAVAPKHGVAVRGRVSIELRVKFRCRQHPSCLRRVAQHWTIVAAVAPSAVRAAALAVVLT